MKKIKFIFSSGLGNQLFMYAAYLHIKKNMSAGTVISPELFPYTYSYVHNGFELPKIFNDSDFTVPFSKLSHKRQRYCRGGEPTLQKYIRLIKDKITGYRNISEAELLNTESIGTILSGKSNLRFCGWFQNTIFINEVIDELRQRRIHYPTLGELNDRTIQEMTNSHSVSIHIRRGDYVGNSYFDIFDGLKYYHLAIQSIKKSVENPVFYIFSDDTDWVKENLKISDSKVVYIDWNTGTDSFKDMIMMSHCRHNIIANSSFSYWGAILNDNEDKIVIAPKRWSKTIDSKDIVPYNWILVDN